MFFFFNDTATTEIYTLSLHDALPISSFDLGAASQDTVVYVTGLGFPKESEPVAVRVVVATPTAAFTVNRDSLGLDRKSTRLNSSHANISYAVFCLKKKNILDSNVRIY